MMRYRAAVMVLLLAASYLGPAAVRAQEGYPHLVLEILRDPRDRVMGYKVHHEFEKVTYVALLAPSALDDPRCRLDRIDYLDVATTGGPPRFVGRSGATCQLVSFRPDVPLPDPEARPSQGSSCTTCP